MKLHGSAQPGPPRNTRSGRWRAGTGCLAIVPNIRSSSQDKPVASRQAAV